MSISLCSESVYLTSVLISSATAAIALPTAISWQLHLSCVRIQPLRTLLVVQCSSSEREVKMASHGDESDSPKLYSACAYIVI